MDKEFIPYELALRMKQLGYDEPCLGYHNIDPYLPKPIFNLVKPFEHEWCLPAPTYSQAFRWFRDKGYRYTISSDCFEVKDAYYFDAWKHQQFYFESGFEYESYEKAQQAALEKLCEIVEKQKEL